MVQWLTFVFRFESKLFTFVFQGMFAIGWLELGEAEKAQLLLEKCFNNIQGPFQVPFGSHIHINTHLTFTGWKIDYLSSQVWSESSDGSGAVNFLTGMGGFLQAVLFGYTGFRLVLNPGNKHFGVFSPQCVHSDTKLHILFYILEFRRTAWHSRHCFPTTSASFVSVVWTTWAARWTGCWGRKKSVSYWGNRKAVQAILSPVIYKLSWRHQELKSPSHQVKHKFKHAVWTCSSSEKVLFMKIIW